MLWCNQCEEQYCEVCYHNLIHRTGRRKAHTYKLLHPEEPLQKSSSQIDLSSQKAANGHTIEKDDDGDDEPMTDERLSAELESGIPTQHTSEQSLQYGKHLRERCRYIPLRLLPHERQLLHLLTAALSVSQYTDRVDILPTHVSRTKRMIIQLKQICAILSGLVVASDFRKGQEMLVEKDFSDHADWFKSVFEIGRRYKIQNPDAMRGSYGMMMYMIQVLYFKSELTIGLDELGSPSSAGISSPCPFEDNPCLSQFPQPTHAPHARRRPHRNSNERNSARRQTQKIVPPPIYGNLT